MSLLLLANQLDRAAVLRRGRNVIRTEARALAGLEAMLDDSFVTACEMILRTDGRIIVTGMGKSGHIGRKIASTLAATGTPAQFVHPAEAGHGDMGMLVAGDTLLVLSNSGNTAELRPMLDHARRHAVPIIGVATHRGSMVMRRADVGLCLPLNREACAANIAPTTSTALQLALGDALAMAVMDMRGISAGRIQALHPAGAIGWRVTTVAALMHTGDRMPLVSGETGMADVISRITGGRMGLAGVVDREGDLLGVISDGDLRRHFDGLGTAVAADVMTSLPLSVPADMLVGDALRLLNGAEITAAFVVDGQDRQHPARPLGIIHIHDLLQHGLN